MELNCGKCKVRSWHPNDVESIVRHANNRKIWLNLRDRFPYPYTKADAQNWIQSALSMRPERRSRVLVSTIPNLPKTKSSTSSRYSLPLSLFFTSSRSFFPNTAALSPYLVSWAKRMASSVSLNRINQQIGPKDSTCIPDISWSASTTTAG